MHVKLETDYVVVGAGTAGCVVATRLSENRAATVVLIEAGGSDSSFLTPLGFGQLFDDPVMAWPFESQPKPELNGARVYQPRDRVVGGTGSINGMVYVRGRPADYDGWHARGNDRMVRLSGPFGTDIRIEGNKAFYEPK